MSGSPPPATDSPADAQQIAQMQALCRKLEAVLELALSLRDVRSERELAFLILNHAVGCVAYDRAAFFRYPGRKLLGISGTDAADPHSRLGDELLGMISRLKEPQTMLFMSEDSFSGDGALWRAYAARNGGTAAAWVPLMVRGRLVGGWWMERWSGRSWQEGEKGLLGILAGVFALGWAALHGGGKPRRGCLRHVWLLVLPLLAGAMFLPVKMRIVAPCEVVPQDPLAVTAGIDGVVERILVRPGDVVRKGGRLVAMRRDTADEEYKAAYSQVQVLRAELARAEGESMADAKKKGELPVLRNRLKQEMVRLEMAANRRSKLEITAPGEGVVMMNDPHEWLGRPVRLGERIMMLVDPAHSKLRILLPVGDRIDLNPDLPVTAVLNNDPAGRRTARLRYLPVHAQTQASGISAFVAEADWLEENPAVLPAMGAQGSAVLTGAPATLGQYLLRRPLAAVRRYLGW